MFIDPQTFLFTHELESASAQIAAEYNSLSPQDFVAWPESDLYDFGWRTFGLMALGHRLEANCARCPRRDDTLSNIPGLVTVGFSLLAAGARIRPHKGYTASVYRLHLGIKVPNDCGIEVGGEVRAWEGGRVLAFDDTTEHSAWNNSDSDRAMLLLDVLRPGARQRNAVKSVVITIVG